MFMNIHTYIHAKYIILRLSDILLFIAAGKPNELKLAHIG